jgi:hypothetical protein
MYWAQGPRCEYHDRRADNEQAESDALGMGVAAVNGDRLR